MLRDLVCPGPLLGLGLEADRFLRVAAALVVELRETLAERRKGFGWRAQRVRTRESIFRVLELATFEVSGDSFLNRGNAAYPSLRGLSLAAQPMPFLEQFLDFGVLRVEPERFIEQLDCLDIRISGVGTRDERSDLLAKLADSAALLPRVESVPLSAAAESPEV